MIHPDSELRFVSPAIGYGLFATRLIPMGSITWAADPLDQIIAPARLATLPAMLSCHVHRYSYLNGRGDRILCWDHGRFVNHSCAAACLSPGFDFEIAVRAIQPGEEITDDYGTLNLEEPFECLCGSKHCRGRVLPDDPMRHAPEWDALLARAFPALAKVEQPLWHLVTEKAAVEQVLAGNAAVPSCLTHYRTFQAAV
ncbi:MAG TPA: SET domain-containing protein-lysine N-methyltransferase [Bryobacteraceae bacterium]|nr:SET domain-containing protein-lysine N-methyltransferase [Bryobacteraceae bacterium]